MPATFVTLSKSDVFRSGGSADHLVRIPSIDSIVGSSGLTVYTQVSAQINETIQFFLTFDDIVKFLHFGKGLGSVQAEGMMFSDCNGNLPGLNKFKSAISGLRGNPITAVIGGMTLKAIMTSAQVNVMSEPDTMATFAVQFTVIDHQL